MSFLDDYQIYSQGNEAPAVYHKWAALSVLSSVVGRKVWVDQGYFQIFPNLYVVFVGPPGNGKSTAMSIARKMVRKFDKIVVAPSSITREKITQIMGKEDSDCEYIFQYDSKAMKFNRMCFYANELVTLLGSNALGMIQFFTDVFDEEVYDVGTKHQGTDVIEYPYITLLGCMTPEITSSLLKQDVISGGFSRRVVFINNDQRGEAVPFPEVTDEQKAAQERCIKHLEAVYLTKGKFIWTEEAREFFASWYRKKHEDLKSNSEIVIKGYLRSKDVQLLKVAMLIALSESFDYSLELRHIKEALSLLDAIEPALSRVFDGTGRNPLAEHGAKIITMLEEAYPNPLTEKQIRVAMFNDLNTQEQQSVLTHYHEVGKIDIVEKTDAAGRPTGIRLISLKKSPR